MMPNNLITNLKSHFWRVFNSEPQTLISAPGRVNLIGEHTDYSDGFVLPVAINLGIMIAMKPRDDRRVKLYSIDFTESIELDLENLIKNDGGWQAYIKGVAYAMLGDGHDLRGWEGVVAGNIPIGAGLSSSAALEIAAVKAFCLSGGFSLSTTTMAKLGKKAETDWVGVNVGIMDQLISAGGKANHAVMLDCRSLDFEYVPIPAEVSFVVLDTKTRRELTGSAYNTRHDEVKMASKALGVPKLRDASLNLLNEKKEIMPATIYRRVCHVLSENKRVHEFSAAMRNCDLEKMGALINKSHVSLRDDYQVSSNELNIIVEIAQSQPACLGARMTGAGFGGCGLALIENANVNVFVKHVHQAYYQETGIEPHIFKITSADGVQACRAS
jgi:galactokinase